MQHNRFNTLSQIIQDEQLRAIKDAEQVEEALELIKQLNNSVETIEILYLLEDILNGPSSSISDIEEPVTFVQVSNLML